MLRASHKPRPVRSPLTGGYTGRLMLARNCRSYTSKLVSGVRRGVGSRSLEVSLVRGWLPVMDPGVEACH